MSLTSAQAAYLGRLATQLSDNRLAPYVRAERGDLSRAIARYYWNVELCRVYYPVLQALEVALRNNIDRAVAPAFPVARWRHVESWIDREPRVAVHPGSEGQIAKAKDAILRRDPSTDGWFPDLGRGHGDLLAATSFGFWVGLLEGAYADPGTRGVVLWGSDPLAPRLEKAVFPGAAGVPMTSIRVTFNRIRQFRNRAFHHEPVWPKRATDPSPQARYDEILAALRWLGGPQAGVPARLHAGREVLDEATQLPAMHRRLLDTVDALLAAAPDKAAEKAARKEARKARKEAERAARVSATADNPDGPPSAG